MRAPPISDILVRNMFAIRHHLLMAIVLALMHCFPTFPYRTLSSWLPTSGSQGELSHRLDEETVPYWTRRLKNPPQGATQELVLNETDSNDGSLLFLS